MFDYMKIFHLPFLRNSRFLSHCVSEIAPRSGANNNNFLKHSQRSFHYESEKNRKC
jgi:hypothetical protein